MSEPHVLRDLPNHLRIVRELSKLEFEFDPRPARPYRIRGFAPDSVVEVIEGPPLRITLLFSAGPQQASLIRSTMSLVALASVLAVDFTGWLAQQISRRGIESPWRSSQRFGHSRVTAEHLSRDAVVLTIEVSAAPGLA